MSGWQDKVQGVNNTSPAPASPVVGVEEIQWLRMRRRTAISEADHAAVRARLSKLSSDLEQRPAPSSPVTFVVLAVVVVLAGFALGWGLYLLADSMWVWLNS